MNVPSHVQETETQEKDESIRREKEKEIQGIMSKGIEVCNTMISNISLPILPPPSFTSHIRILLFLALQPFPLRAPFIPYSI